MCGRPGGFLGNILAEIAYSFAMPGYGYASRPQASIGFSFSWVVFCRYKFIPTNTLKSRCILPTLYGRTTKSIRKTDHSIVLIIFFLFFFLFSNSFSYFSCVNSDLEAVAEIYLLRYDE